MHPDHLAHLDEIRAARLERLRVERAALVAERKLTPDEETYYTEEERRHAIPLVEIEGAGEEVPEREDTLPMGVDVLREVIAKSTTVGADDDTPPVSKRPRSRPR